MPSDPKGYIVRAVFLRDKGGGNIEIASPVEFVASSASAESVLGRYLQREVTARPGWQVHNPICEEVQPELLRLALGLDDKPTG